MEISQSFTTPSGLQRFGDRGPWANRGRRVTEPIDGESHVLLPLPSTSHVAETWYHVVRTMAQVRTPHLALPRSVIDDDGQPAWLLYDDLPTQTFAALMSDVGGGIQEEVLPAMAQAVEGLAVLHDHGLTLRRLALRDLIAVDTGWLLMLTPDSGIRPFHAGAEAREIHGDLLMIAAAAATVLTGRRPTAGRVRAPLTSVCPTLPTRPLEALDGLLGEYDATEHAMSIDTMGRDGQPWGDAARQLAGELAVNNEVTLATPGDAQDGPESITQSLPPVPDRPAKDPGGYEQSAADRVFAMLPAEQATTVFPDHPHPHGQGEMRDLRRNRRARPWAATTVDRSAVRSKRPVLVMAAVLLVGAGGTAAWSMLTGASSSNTQEAVADFPTHKATTTPPALTGGEATTAGNNSTESGDMRTTLEDLVQARALALREDDPVALAAVYTDNSPHLAEDRKTLEAVEPDPATGTHVFSELSMRIDGEITVLESTSQHARLRATVSADGMPADQRSEQDIEVTMTRQPQGWRLDTVQPL
ncbi:MAG: hypothetical protein Q4C81_06675 [Kocuria sp.]|nr:hypothetical protein [Kocuria sp.]